MKLRFQQKTTLNYIMAHAKKNLNPASTTTRNHFEIEVIKPSFQSTFGNWKANPKITILNNNNCNIKQLSAKDLTYYVFVWIQFHLTWKSWQLRKHTGSSLYMLILFDPVIWSCVLKFVSQIELWKLSSMKH